MHWMINYLWGEDGKKEKEKDQTDSHTHTTFLWENKVKRKQSGLSACVSSHPSPLVCPQCVCLRHRRWGNIALSHLQPRGASKGVLMSDGRIDEAWLQSDTSFGIPCSSTKQQGRGRPSYSCMASRHTALFCILPQIVLVFNTHPIRMQMCSQKHGAKHSGLSSVESPSSNLVKEEL